MKKLKGIVLAVIILLASIMMPFDVYADTLSTSNITYNYYLTDVVDSTSQLANKNYIYDVDFVFDKSYLGWVSISMITSYIYATNDTRQATYTKAIYVNGNTAKTSIVISSNFTGANGSPLSSMSITVNNSNVTPLADLSSLQDIIDLLQDIDDHISIDILSELQDVVYNTSLANNYLEAISKLRQFNFPIESLGFISYFITDTNKEYIDLYDYLFYSYPIFKMNDTQVFQFLSNSKYVLILGINKQVNNVSSFNNVFTYTNATLDSVSVIQQGRFSYNNTLSNFYILKVEMTRTSSGSNLKLIDNTDTVIMPIYAQLAVRTKYVSTDFALQFGLRNELLDYLQTIAIGTSQSNSAASDLESGNSQMADDMDDLATIESGYNQQFNNQLQSIDFTSPIQSNSGILPAANFVISIFNGLINNNPFSVLIIVVCILLIGKKVIGK